MDHERHGRNDDKHHHRYRVEQYAEVNLETAPERQPFEIPRHLRRIHSGGIPARRKIRECRPIAEQRHNAGHDSTGGSGNDRAQLCPEQTYQDEAQERKQ